MKKYLNLRTNIALGLIFAFLANIFDLPVYAQEFTLPAPGRMVALSPAYSPAVLKGIKLDPQNPFRFQFFVDRGDESPSSTVIPAKAGIQDQEQLKIESAKLIKYFLASLTIPEKDLWVNLSPYEKDRIVPQEFGQTEMGRDLLAQDYILKQITASVVYPESRLGKEFWQKVYAQAQAKYGTTNIPVNTFNKVWIIPEKAVVYENGGTAFVLENHLKVMLEEDYLSLLKHQTTSSTNTLGSQIVREIVIPALTKEVNEGKNFAPLRQVFYSLILATWYKKKIKDSILNIIYSDKKKTQGLVIPAKAGIQNKDNVEYIYQQYLQAFKKGVYNYIKEEPDPITNQTYPRKYFSGGVTAFYSQAMITVGPAQVNKVELVELSTRHLINVTGDTALISPKKNAAMNSTDNVKKAIELVGSVKTKDVAILNLLEKLKLSQGNKILSIGPGANIAHLIYGALTEAQVDVVHPFGVRMQEYNQAYDAALKKDITISNTKLKKYIHTKFYSSGGAASAYEAVIISEKLDGLSEDQAKDIIKESVRTLRSKGLLILDSAWEKVVVKVKKESEDIFDFEEEYPGGIVISILKVQDLAAGIASRLMFEGKPISKEQFQEFINAYESGSFPETMNEKMKLFKKIIACLDEVGLDTNNRQAFGEEKILSILKLTLKEMDPFGIKFVIGSKNAAMNVSHPLLNKRILLAEDGDFTREAVKTYLEREGAVVITAEDGMQALKEFNDRKGQFDLILTDRSMPRMDGVDFLKSLNGQKTKVPIIIWSSSLILLQHELANTGLNGVVALSKGIGLEGLAKKIREMTNAAQLSTPENAAMKTAVQEEIRFNEAKVLRRDKRMKDALMNLKIADDLKPELVTAYEGGQILAYTKGRPNGNITPFLDTVFKKASEYPGGKQATKIVFPRAGAESLYAAARLMAQVTGVFPAGNMKSIWATIDNYLAIKKDPGQAELFVKYLYDQKVIGPGTKNVLIVDTDTGIPSSKSKAGTEVLFAKTIFDDAVIDRVNKRFGLKLPKFNKGEGSINTELFFIHSEYELNPGRDKKFLSKEGVTDIARLHMSGFNAKAYDAINKNNDIFSWADGYTKLQSIEPEFKLIGGKAKAIEVESYGQRYTGRTLRIFYNAEYAGLSMGILNVLEARGYNIDRVAQSLIDSFKEKALPSATKTANAAMKVQRHEGGINLNPAQMSMQVKKEGQDFKFDFNGTEIDPSRVTGAIFTIRTMTPVTDLPQILGLK